MELNKILNFFTKKRVFITGHTGFKGSWLSFILDSLGAEIVGYSLEPNTKPSLFNNLTFSSKFNSIIGDIRDKEKFKRIIHDFKPEYIFHLAAQPIVLESFQNPCETFETNFNGTLNLLETLKELDTQTQVVFITTDKVYENQEFKDSFKESDKLGGKDPYSASKAATEILIYSYKQSFFKETKIRIATARAGNVIGGGDWSENRLIPDIVRSIYENKKLLIRNPKATRPWQHVLEPIDGYLQLAIALKKGQIKFQDAWNFGPEIEDNKSVEELIEITKTLGFDLDVYYEENETKKEAKYLSLNIDKAKRELKWKPKWSSKKALHQTLFWYEEFYNGSNPNLLLKNEIEKYYNK